MKYLTLALLLLSGCVRNLQVGECIIEVGRYSVKFIDEKGNGVIITKEDLDTNGTDRLDCFELFDKGGGK